MKQDINDRIADFIARVIVTLFFFNPLVYWVLSYPEPNWKDYFKNYWKYLREVWTLPLS